MSYLSEIPKNSLSVKIERSSMAHLPLGRIVVKTANGFVYLSIDGKVVELSTITAHKIGMAILKSKLDYNDLIVLEINKERFEFLWEAAKRVAGALLVKADHADDWQLNRGNKQ